MTADDGGNASVKTMRESHAFGRRLGVEIDKDRLRAAARVWTQFPDGLALTGVIGIQRG